MVTLADSSKLKELGWQTEVSIIDGIDSCFEIF